MLCLILGKAILCTAAVRAMLIPWPTSVAYWMHLFSFYPAPPPPPPKKNNNPQSRSKTHSSITLCQTSTHHLLSQCWRNRGADTFSQKTPKKNAQYWLTLVPTSYQNATDFRLPLSFSLGTTTAARRVVHSGVYGVSMLTYLHVDGSVWCSSSSVQYPTWRPTLLAHAGLFQCFHNPPSSNKDCRILNVHMWPFCMHIIHRQDLRLQTHQKAAE